METRILLIVTGLIFLLATAYSKAEPEYVWVTEEKYDHISSIVFTADSNYIVVNGLMLDGKTTRYTILDVENGEVVKQVNDEGHIFAFTKDGRYAYSFKGVFVYKLSASTLTPYDSVEVNKYFPPFNGYGLSADEQRIFLSGGQVWQGVGINFLVIDIPSFNVITEIQLSNYLSSEIAVSPANDYFAILNYYLYGDASHSWGERKVELYNAQTLELVKSFKLEKEYKLNNMQFSYDGRYFAIRRSLDISTINNELLIYNTLNDFELIYNDNNENNKTALTFLPKQNHFYICISTDTSRFLQEKVIGSSEMICNADIFHLKVSVPQVFTLNNKNMIVRTRDLSYYNHLAMVKNPCYVGTNVTETGENKEIKSITVIDNKISIPIENQVITNLINWQIHDIMGNQILSGIEHSVTNELQIDVSILPSGTYFLTLQFEKETVNFKLIKSK